jgi:DNA-binding response OmpR family regulator
MKKSIWILDDDIDIAEAINFILEDEGYTTQLLKEATHILEDMHARKPSLLILDVLMSGVDGRDICAAIKADPALKSVPIIMVSAHPSAKEDIASYGADYFLAKPFEADELIRLVKKFV